MIVGELRPVRLTCTDQHLPGCFNPWFELTWCICGHATWPGHVGVWHSMAVTERASTSDSPWRAPAPTVLGWDTYFRHAPHCTDRDRPCIPHCAPSDG